MTDDTSTSGRWVLLRRLAAAGGGLLAAALVAAVAVGAEALPDRLGGLAGSGDPGPTGPDARAVQVAVPPAEQAFVCAGPAHLTDPEEVGDEEFAAAPVGTLSSLRALVLGEGGGAALTDLTGEDLGLEPTGDGPPWFVASDDVDGPAVLRVQPGATDDGTARLGTAATSGSLTPTGDLRGLAAASCGAPGLSHWLVGGSTEIGSSSQLVLHNPGRTPASVRTSVWGPGGPVALAGGAQLLVPPGEHVVTLVEAAAPEQRRLVVHVEAEGGLVTATLQHATLAGLVPHGVDFVVPGSGPARDVALTGVVSTGEAVDDPLAPRLRLLAPGEEDGVARIAVQGPDGPVRLRGAEDVELSAGVVADVSLGGLPEGRYAVVVDADVPVVAGAVVSRPGEPDPEGLVDETPVDRAWIAGRALADLPAAGAGQVALLPGASAEVTLSALPGTDPVADDAPEGPPEAPGDVRGVLRVYAADGTETGARTVTLAPGTTQTVVATDVGDGAEPAAVAFERTDDDGAAVTWSVLLSAVGVGDAEDVPSLVSVLLPVADEPGLDVVVVRPTDTAGLG